MANDFFPERNVNIILGVDCPGNNENGDFKIKIHFHEIGKYLTFPIDENIWNQLTFLIRSCKEKDKK